MNATSLQNKTIRPGSLASYSYYHSARQPMGVGAARTVPQFPKATIPKVSHAWRRRLLVTALILVSLIVLPLLRGGSGPVASVANDSSASSAPSGAAAIAAPALTGKNRCAGNKQGQLVLVSISQRHLWACQGSKTAYDSPVITGIQAHESTVTPPGTYHIYAKQTNTTLTGADETGSWSDPVQYWMPFLNNQYGTYGFHDATWRPANSFGKVSPSSNDASHGCVELPLATSAWLYNWSQVGTTVTIEN
ncbi:MAG TPA: L,D-transpeptidase [Candidatus Dormibacteraeota bacterium]|nr:L,D-transpeptidase [Candidatus Dormibacteraeota bacterium]